METTSVPDGAVTDRGTFAFERNRATLAEVTAHLRDADSQFQPPLSTRVDLAAYAAKLLARAERFEARAADRLVGLVAAYCNQGPTAFVTSVSVLSPWRGHGIARILMEQCLAEARRRGAARIGLEVDRGATAALNLYRRLGFAAPDDDQPAATAGPGHSTPVRLCLTLEPQPTDRPQ